MADDDYNSQAVDWLKQNNLPGQNLTAYKPSIRDIIANKLLGDNPSFPRQQFTEGLLGTRGIGQTGKTSLADVTPLGPILDAPDIAKSGTPAAAAGMFIGPSAKNWSLPGQLMAKDMEMKGFSPEDIFDKTGLFKGHEGNWRKEISDVGMQSKPLDNSMYEGELEGFINHPELFENYPDLKSLIVGLDPQHRVLGTYHINTGKGVTLRAAPSDEGLNQKERQVLLHELQHAVQDREGWPTGSNVKLMADRISRGPSVLPRSDPDVASVLGYEEKRNKAKSMYLRSPGETEARNVESRYRIPTLGVPATFPMTTNLNDVADALKHQGWSIEQTSRSPRPSYYSLTDPTNIRRTSYHLPQELRAFFDRLPERYESKTNRPVSMAGYQGYPWKTEDIPRWLQQEFE